MKYRPELDALRFCAFLAVFATHAIGDDPASLPRLGALAPAIVAVARAGAYGVDVFFCLSAYLITSLLLSERERTGRLNIPAFYMRRILRIWPLYFAALGIFFIADPLPLLPFITFTANWWMVFHGHPSHAAAPLWSVSVEEQFYLAWPLLLLFFSPRRAALGMLIVATGARILLIGAGPDTFWMHTFVRLDPIACGILLACARAPEWRRDTRLLLGGAALLSILLVSLTTARNGPSALIGYPVVALASALLIAASNAARPPRWLVYGGKISFGLYVFHEFCLGIPVAIGLPFVTRPFVGLLLTVAVAAVSYRYLERPFLKVKQRFTPKPLSPRSTVDSDTPPASLPPPAHSPAGTQRWG